MMTRFHPDIAPRLLVLLAALALGGCQGEIIGNLDQRAAHAIELVLLKNGVKPEVITGKSGAFSIAVDQSARFQALSIIADAGLPQTEYASVDKIFPGTGFLVTPIEQRARLTFAVEQQLSQTISAIDGVRSARVHVVMSEENGRGLVQVKARAATLVVYRDGADTVALEDKVRALVLNSVGDLDFEDVSVVLTRSGDDSEEHAPQMPLAEASEPGHGITRNGIVAILAGVALAMIGSLRLLRLPKPRQPMPALPGRAG